MEHNIGVLTRLHDQVEPSVMTSASYIKCIPYKIASYSDWNSRDLSWEPSRWSFHLAAAREPDWRLKTQQGSTWTSSVRESASLVAFKKKVKRASAQSVYKFNKASIFSHDFVAQIGHVGRVDQRPASRQGPFHYGVRYSHLLSLLIRWIHG